MTRTCLMLVSLSLIGTAVSCGGEEPPPPATIRPVRYVEVETTGGPRTRTFSGVAEAAEASTLSFRVPGTIERLPATVGSRVEAGQVLAELDAVDYQLQVRQAEAALRQAEAQASNASADLRRVQSLYENDNATRDDLDAATAASASASAQVEAATQRLDLAERQVAYTRLTAPVAGAIADVRVEANENVAAGQPVAVLTAELQPEVALVVPETLIGQIAERDSVEVRFDALPGRTFRGVVTEVGVSASALATTFPVSVQLEEAREVVRPGMAADVTFDFEVGNGGRIVLPFAAVGEDRDGRFVFVAEPSGRDRAIARRRPVEVGEFVADGLEITGGVTAGEFVVTAGVSQLENGREVRLLGTGGD